MAKASEVDRIIGETYETLADRGAWGQVLASYAEVVGGDTALIYLRPRTDVAGVLLTCSGFGPSYQLGRYLSYYEARSALVARFRHQPEGRVCGLGDFAFSSAYRDSEYFRDWVRPQGFADFLGAHLVRTPQLYAWMSIRRSEKRGLYTN